MKKWVIYDDDYYYVKGRNIFGYYILINSLADHVFLNKRKFNKIKEFIPDQQYNKEEQVLYKHDKYSDTYYISKIRQIDNNHPYRPYLIDTDNGLIWATPQQLYKYDI